jgi:hypothetical protein
MILKIKEYFTALFHSWVGKMSGPASVVLAFLPIIWPGLFGQSTILIRATWIAAVVCFLIANFSAWSYERDKYEAEAHKNTLPLIKGSLSNISFGGTVQTGQTLGKWHIVGAVNFDLYLCNQMPRDTNLQRLELDGSALNPPVQFGRPALLTALGAPSDVRRKAENAVVGIVLADGKGITIPHLLVSATVHEFQDKSQIPPIDLKDLKVFAVDGFLNRHLLSVEDGAKLIFQWGQ